MTAAVQEVYGTDKAAVVYHCPYPMRVPDNPFHLEWLAAIEQCLSDPVFAGVAAVPRDDLTVVTYNTRPEPCLLERCFDHLGWPGLVVLGRGVSDWSWRHKITLVDDYLRSGACRTPYLLCLDGDDVIVVGDPAVLVDRFTESGSEVVFCGTRGNQPASEECWDFENLVGAHRDPLHRHLNAGCYLGRTAYIADRLAEIAAAMATDEAWCLADGHPDDQLAWRQLHRREHPRIDVDAECRLFLRFDEDR